MPAKLVKESPAVIAERRKVLEKEYGSTSSNEPSHYIQISMKDVKRRFLIEDETTQRLIAENEWSEIYISNMLCGTTGLRRGLKITAPLSERENKLNSEKESTKQNGALLLTLKDPYEESTAQIYIFEDDRPIQVIDTPQKRSKEIQKAIDNLTERQEKNLKIKKTKAKYGCFRDVALTILGNTKLKELLDEVVKHNSTESAPIKVRSAERSHAYMGHPNQNTYRLKLTRRHKATNTEKELRINVSMDGLLNVIDKDELTKPKMYNLFGQAINSLSVKASQMRQAINAVDPMRGAGLKEAQSYLNTERGRVVIEYRYSVRHTDSAHNIFEAKKLRPFLKAVRAAALHHDPIHIKKFAPIGEGLVEMTLITRESIFNLEEEKEQLRVWMDDTGLVEFEESKKETPQKLQRARISLTRAGKELRRQNTPKHTKEKFTPA